MSPETPADSLLTPTPHPSAMVPNHASPATSAYGAAGLAQPIDGRRPDDRNLGGERIDGEPTRAGADTTLLITAMLEEYRQLYALAIFRLQALDQRLMLAGAGLLATLASIVVLPERALWVMLVAAPMALPWLLRSTIRHAGSFQDALDRIAAIEAAVNGHVGVAAMTFQSTHPSRGMVTGGRTGHEAIEAIQGVAAITLGGCLFLALSPSASASTIAATLYAFGIALVAGGLIGIVQRTR